MSGIARFGNDVWLQEGVVVLNPVIQYRYRDARARVARCPCLGGLNDRVALSQFGGKDEILLNVGYVLHRGKGVELLQVCIHRHERDRLESMGASSAHARHFGCQGRLRPRDIAALRLPGIGSESCLRCEGNSQPHDDPGGAIPLRFAADG